MFYYIEDKINIILADADLQRLSDTLDFMPQYKENRIMESDLEITDWNTPDKCITELRDFEEEITVEVSPAIYEEQEVFDMKDIYTPVLDENGEQVYNDSGEPQYLVTQEKILVPEYTYNVYKEDENGFPVLDEDGNPTILDTVTVPEHYKSHVETVLVQEAVYENQTILVQHLVPVLNPEYDNIIEQQRLEELAMLNLTAADVERAIYKATNMDFDDILGLVVSLNEAGKTNIDVKALKIEFKANNFYRGNPYIDQVGLLLGFTSEMLDEFFLTNDYTKLLPPSQPEQPTEA